MPHSLASSDSRRFLKTSHWIAPSMPAKPSPPYNSKSRSHTTTTATKRGSSTDSTSRVDKRKRRRPIRSLPAPDDAPSAFSRTGESTPRTSCTLKMSYLDDYQRNPTAYSRALMGTACLPDYTASCPNTASIFITDSKPHHIRRVQSSTTLSSRSMSMSMSLASSPTPTSETSVSEPPTQHHQLQRRRSVVRRLFPALNDDALAAFAATAAAQRPSSPRPKKKRNMAASSPGNSMAGALHSADSAQVADPGSNGNTADDSGADVHTPQTINNGSIAMFVGDKLGREIFRLHPQANSCPIKWTKASPMDVRGYPLAEFLASGELDCCSILRLQPEQYLAIKHSLVRAGRTMPAGTFKKRDAQKLCRVDVNKTSKVFEWFCKLGWIPQAVPKFGGYDHNSNEPHGIPIDY
ncbi:hypothetical protein IW140_004380 [Coemansia sp. RSA 1813]|nr:hypothetical protein EV178_004450 [Coemansia sp. RSA 1646]KAJ1768362.1 hypothetical protein LPJ74_004890 [Coemansia sp. RSA 1843]KAJ2087897.1 hypothetical protein IW138_004595 [Coemansia sp. RSA 986]KAJ2212907.1 hypothetical protein EV179_004308 [Coemansia sp. RSA 487]KAJ2567677.1 hypothetical protein IW140_004380 [Coemansia sp. RSA 1813]